MRLPARLARGVLACLLALAFVSLAANVPSFAQDATAPKPAPLAPAARLDTDKATVDRIEAALGRADLSDASLQQFGTDLAPVSTDLQSIVAELSPRLDAAKARLDQLGPKPTDKNAAESADISTERANQEKLFSDLDATVKRAKVLSVQVGQIGDAIAARRRAQFTRSTFAHTFSILSPALWTGVAADLPSDARALAYRGQDWLGVVGKAETWKAALVGLLLGALAVVFWPALRLSRRFKQRRADAKPTHLRRALLASWVALVTVGVPTFLVAAAIGILDLADFIPFGYQPIANALFFGTVRVGLMAGLARGLLAPGLPNWRLVKISDASARNLYKLTVTIASIVALVGLVVAVNGVIAAAPQTTIAVHGLGVLLIAVAMARTLHRIDRIVGAMDQAEAPQAPARNWAGPARILGWTIATVLAAALLAGYVDFAAFVTRQIVFLTGLYSLLYLLMVLANEGVAALLQPKTRIGRAFVVTAGFRRESLDQAAILLSGALRVALIVWAVTLTLAPWRIGAGGDVLASLQSAFFGFSVGDMNVSLSTIAVAIVLFVAGIAVTRGVQRWLDATYLPSTKLDAGLRNSIKTSFGYLGVVLAAAVAASHLGLSFEKVTYVAGALSVGIGFGLQAVVSNFVSGLIILWERAIRVGDWIVVGPDEGFVRRINVRSTEIETFDRATVIVPNQTIMTGTVKNWVRGDRVGRILLPITVGLAAKPEEMREMLIGIAKEHDRVLKIPSPSVLFASYAGDQMTFSLICFVEDVEAGKRTTSDLLFAIHAKLTEKGIIAPPGPAQLSSPALEKAIALLMEDKDASIRQVRRA